MPAIPPKVQGFDLPDTWRRKRIKYVATYNDEALSDDTDDFKEIKYIEISGVSLVGGVENVSSLQFHKAPSRARRVVRGGDTLVSTVRTYLKAIATVREAPDNLIASTGFCVIRPGEEIDAAFLGWVMKSEPIVGEIVARSVGVSYPATNASEVVKLDVPLPDLDTQRRIAGYLDDKTARIDALIEKKRALLDRLAEKRQALITRAVTRGLNPDAPLKDSGIDWLGKVPAHWEVKPVKRVAKLQSGHTPDKQHDEYWNGDIPWVSLNDTTAIRSGDYIEETAFNITPKGIANSSARLLPARAVVFTRDATIGEAAITTRPMAVSQHIIAWLCPEELLAPEFLLFVIYGMRGELMRITNGTTIGTIGMGDVKAIRIALPPHDEQAEIVAYVTERKARVEQVMRRVEASIEKLTEYRAALVTAAVTGKIKALLAEDVPKPERLDRTQEGNQRRRLA